jgi:hypothetical protein
VKGVRKNESPSGVALRNPKELRPPPGNRDSKDDGSKAENGRKHPILRLRQGVVANDRVKGQAGREESNNQPSERAVCLARKNTDLPHQIPKRHDHEDRRDNLEQKEELRDHTKLFSVATTQRPDCRSPRML